MAYQVERQFYTEFGAAQPPLHRWPERKLRDYSIIMQVIGEVERDEQAKQARQAKAPTGRGAAGAAATEEAFQNLPRIPRDGPPPT